MCEPGGQTDRETEQAGGVDVLNAEKGREMGEQRGKKRERQYLKQILMGAGKRKDGAAAG